MVKSRPRTGREIETETTTRESPRQRQSHLDQQVVSSETLLHLVMATNREGERGRHGHQRNAYQSANNSASERETEWYWWWW